MKTTWVIAEAGTSHEGNFDRAIELIHVAVGAGATIVEAHLRLADTSPDHPDYVVSHPPEQFARYVALIRHAEALL